MSNMRLTERGKAVLALLVCLPAAAVYLVVLAAWFNII